MLIREMITEDIDSVLEIEENSFEHPWIAKHFEDEINSDLSYPFVVEKNHKIIAYICLKIVGDEAEILDIAVKNEFRSSGIATKLIKFAEDFSFKKYCAKIMLEVRNSNIAAINLYKKFGFEVSGIRKRYYEGKEDALLMDKNIAGEKR